MDKDLKTVVIYDKRCKYLERWKQPLFVDSSRIRTSVLLKVDALIADSYLYANNLLKTTLMLQLEECWPELAMCYFCKKDGLLLGFYAERTGEFSYTTYLKHCQSKSCLLHECNRILLMPVHLWKESREELLTLQPVNVLTSNWLQIMSWWKRINTNSSYKSKSKYKALTKSGINLKNLTDTVKKVIFLFEEQQRIEESKKDKTKKGKEDSMPKSPRKQKSRTFLVSRWWQRFFRQTEELSITLTSTIISFVTSIPKIKASKTDNLDETIYFTLENYFKKMGLSKHQCISTVDFLVQRLIEEAHDTYSKLYEPIDTILTLENMEKSLNDNCLMHYAYEIVTVLLYNTSNLLSVSALTALFSSKNVNQIAVETVMNNVDKISKDAKRWVEQTLQEGYYYLGYLKRQLLDVRDDYTTNCAKLVSSILSALDLIVRDKDVTDFRNNFATYNLYAVIMFSIANVCSKRYIGPSWYNETVLQDYKERLYNIMLSLQNELMSFLDYELNLHEHVDYQLSKSRPLHSKN